jgi:hypothetical protein
LQITPNPNVDEPNDTIVEIDVAAIFPHRYHDHRDYHGCVPKNFRPGEAVLLNEGFGGVIIVQNARNLFLYGVCTEDLTMETFCEDSMESLGIYRPVPVNRRVIEPDGRLYAVKIRDKYLPLRTPGGIVRFCCPCEVLVARTPYVVTHERDYVSSALPADVLNMEYV